MRTEMARTAARAAARHRADIAGGLLCPGTLSRRAAPTDHDGDGARLGRLWAGIPAAAPPQLAKHRLAEKEPVVRGRSPASAAKSASGTYLKHTSAAVRAVQTVDRVRDTYALQEPAKSPCRRCWRSRSPPPAASNRPASRR